MEKSTPIGLVAGFGLVFGAVALGDGAATFFDPKSLLIVVGGTVAGLLVTFSMAEVGQVVPAVKGFFGFQAPNLGALADQLTDFAKTARRDGPLALESQAGEVEDSGLRLAVEMAVDGASRDRAESALRAQAAAALAQPALLVKVLNKAGMYAPAFGMVGTLIGLIQMLQNLNDPAAIGPAMAVAMITTFWGALLANLVFLPMAGKAQNQLAARAKAQALIRTGALGILSGEAPTQLAQQLDLLAGREGPGEAAPVTPLRKAA
jgi:chemotaxis protein MotA